MVIEHILRRLVQNRAIVQSSRYERQQKWESREFDMKDSCIWVGVSEMFLLIHVSLDVVSHSRRNTGHPPVAGVVRGKNMNLLARDPELFPRLRHICPLRLLTSLLHVRRPTWSFSMRVSSFYVATCFLCPHPRFFRLAFLAFPITGFSDAIVVPGFVLFFPPSPAPSRSCRRS